MRQLLHFHIHLTPDKSRHDVIRQLLRAINLGWIKHRSTFSMNIFHFIIVISHITIWPKLVLARGPLNAAFCWTAAVYLIIEPLHKCSTITIRIQMRWMTPKQHRTLQNKGYSIYILLPSLPLPTPKFQSPASNFRVTFKLFWDKCTEWPQNDIEYYEITGTSTPETKVLVRFAL